MSLLRRLFGKAAPESVPETTSSRPPSEPTAEPLLVNAYVTVRDMPPLVFPHTLMGQRDRFDPELADHLRGFIGYILGRGDRQMTALRYHLWRHIQRVRNHLSFDVAEADLPSLARWAQQANAVFFLPDGSVRAPDMATILSADGDSDSSAELPYPADAVARRQRTREALFGIEPQPPASIPPAIGEGELVLHAPLDVLRRGLACFYVAARGQAQREGGEPIAAGQRDSNPAGAAALSPAETGFLETPDTDQDAAAAMTWRYEAANTLFWALGIDAADITDSDRLIDVDRLWSAVADHARSGDATTLQLRPAGEMLDALDRTWLEHWIVRQARQNGVSLDGLNGDIVTERHHALNWLTGFQNDPGTSWDDTDTPT